MGQTNRRVCGVDTLSTVTGRTHDIDTDIFVIDHNIELLCLRHDCNRRSGRMDSSSGLGLRDTLYTVNTALVF